MKSYFVYIMTNRSGTLYVGMTSNLPGRVYQHQNRVHEGFTSRYHVYRLVFFEEFSQVDDAIARERQIKRWGKTKKLVLIGRMNPEWRDLSSSLR